MSATPDQMIVGLDIGSSALTLLALTRDASGALHYRESLRAPSRGVKQGVIVNIQDATDAIQEALYTLEERSGLHAQAVCAGIGGRRVTSQNTRGSVTIAPAGREIEHDDVLRAIADARAQTHITENHEILHEIPRAYMVDGQAGVQDPHGMAAMTLDVEAYYALCSSTTLRNLLKCVGQTQARPELVVASPLAAGEATRDEFADTSCLAVVDIGAETTDIALYVSDAIWMTTTIPIGGEDITRAIASQFRVSRAVAEELKLRYGACDLQSIDEFELVEMPAAAGVEAVLPRAELIRVIAERATAQSDALLRSLEPARQVNVTPEIVTLSGGGALLPGIERLMIRALEIPTRRVAPGLSSGIKGLPGSVESPIFATAMGLALWNARYIALDDRLGGKRRNPLPQLLNGVKRLLGGV